MAKAKQLTKIQKFERAIVRGVNKYIKDGRVLICGSWTKGDRCCALTAAFGAHNDMTANIRKILGPDYHDQMWSFVAGYDDNVAIEQPYFKKNYYKLGQKIRARYEVTA